MGNSKSKNANQEEKFHTLLAAQRLTRTDNGQAICKDTSELMTKSGIVALCRDRQVLEEKRLVLQPPFSNLDRVTSHLYITGIGGLTYENFHMYQITCVINATHDLPLLKHKLIESYRVPLEDDITEDMLMFFDDVSDKIYEVAKRGGRTVVHCMAGVSRSATLVIAYLIKYRKMSCREAFLMVRRTRFCIRPNIAFVAQLMAYERKLRGSCQSKMVKFVYQKHLIRMPDFYEQDCQDIFRVEVTKQTTESGTSYKSIK